jgi:hypothetical protein
VDEVMESQPDGTHLVVKKLDKLITNLGGSLCGASKVGGQATGGGARNDDDVDEFTENCGTTASQLKKVVEATAVPLRIKVFNHLPTSAVTITSNIIPDDIENICAYYNGDTKGDWACGILDIPQSVTGADWDIAWTGDKLRRVLQQIARANIRKVYSMIVFVSWQQLKEMEEVLRMEVRQRGTC